jgi:hypothetical protein
MNSYKLHSHFYSKIYYIYFLYTFFGQIHNISLAITFPKYEGIILPRIFS